MKEDHQHQPLAMSLDDASAAESSNKSTLIDQQPLPDEVLDNVLENVLHFLTARRDRSAASLVCKLWYRVEAYTRSDVFIGNCYAVSPSRVVERFKRVKGVVLKGKPRFADFNLVPENWGAHFEPWIVAFGGAYPFMEKLCLKRMNVSDENLVMLADSFVDFKELVLVCCEGFSSTGLAAVVSSCRSLKVLDLVESEVEDDGVDWVSQFPEGETCLESLVFDCLEFAVDFEALENLVARSPKLKRLKVNQFVSTEQLYRLMVRAPQLTDLGTGSFGPSEIVEGGGQGLHYQSAFASCNSLVCLSGFREIVPDNLPMIFPVCANLTYLNFSYANVNSLQLRSVIRHCHKLQIFWVLDSIRDEGLQAVAETCKDLRELRVFPIDVSEDSDGPVSEVGFRAISEGCRRLESILFFCQRMTNAAVIDMSNNCPDLMAFRLCIMGRLNPDHLTGEPMDEGFGAIVRNCRKLTRLAVSGKLTDEAFRYIGQYGKLVRTLSVAFAGNSDMALKYVLEGCPNLQKLEIRDSPFGNESLRSGLHHYYNMRFLWMSSCDLTLGGCKVIARAKPHLVMEVIESDTMEDDDKVDTLYMYRSLVGPRTDIPNCVTIL